jgi:hypothetical protein
MPAVESKKRNSILGSLALLLAVPAVGLSYFDFPGLPNVEMGPFVLRFPVAVAASVTTLALLSLLLASRSRRTGTEIPLAALMVSTVALGLGLYRHRTPAPPPPVEQPAQGVAPAAKSPAAPPAAVAKPASKPPVVPNTANLANRGKKAANTATDTALRSRNLALLRQAEADYDTARAAVIKSLETDPAYAAAKSEADSTMADLKRARVDYAPGSKPLIEASEKALGARDKLQVLIESAIAKDPDAARARDQLDAVKASMQRPTGARP